MDWQYISEEGRLLSDALNVHSIGVIETLQEKYDDIIKLNIFISINLI